VSESEKGKTYPHHPALRVVSSCASIESIKYSRGATQIQPALCLAIRAVPAALGSRVAVGRTFTGGAEGRAVTTKTCRIATAAHGCGEQAVDFILKARRCTNLPSAHGFLVEHWPPVCDSLAKMFEADATVTTKIKMYASLMPKKD